MFMQLEREFCAELLVLPTLTVIEPTMNRFFFIRGI